MLTVPPTTALQPAPLSIEGLPLPIAAAIAQLVSAAIYLGTRSTGDWEDSVRDEADERCIALRRVLVDAIRAELSRKPAAAGPRLDASGHITLGAVQ